MRGFELQCEKDTTGFGGLPPRTGRGVEGSGKEEKRETVKGKKREEEKIFLSTTRELVHNKPPNVGEETQKDVAADTKTD